MSARILVIDDIETNRRLLEARLSAEYFEVLLAADGPTGLELARTEEPDLILLDIMMPGMDGFEVCKRLKADDKLRHIPVVMVTALDEREGRIRGLKAGADEFLTKPVDEIALFARVRSLLRLKAVTDELRLRDLSSGGAQLIKNQNPDVTVIAMDEKSASRIADHLDPNMRVHVTLEPQEALRQARASDLVIVDLSSPRFDGLRICARIRSDAETRQLPILAIVSNEDRPTMVRALDLGVNDVAFRPVDPVELNARAGTLIQRKSYTDALRDRLEESLELAVTDSLTGLYNRRYLMSRARQGLEALRKSGEPMAMAILDLDHFKRVNDVYGHQAGDRVLRRFAELAGGAVRALDIAGRYGGEEFVIMFADSSLEHALQATERLRARVASDPFVINSAGETLQVTFSAGVAEARPNDEVEDIIERADRALYDAKASGRNQVRHWRKSAA